MNLCGLIPNLARWTQNKCSLTKFVNFFGLKGIIPNLEISSLVWAHIAYVVFRCWSACRVCLEVGNGIDSANVGKICDSRNLLQFSMYALVLFSYSKGWVVYWQDGFISLLWLVFRIWTENICLVSFTFSLDDRVGTRSPREARPLCDWLLLMSRRNQPMGDEFL
jgi:hypothetical protein